MADDPRLIEHRKAKGNAAVVFLHGFSGDAVKTWGNFPAFLQREDALATWGIYSIGYSSSLAFDIAGIWSADPKIVTLGGLLGTVANEPPLSDCGALAFVAHSMGGLMLQRGLLSTRSLLTRTSHVALFGTPSAGLKKASPFAFWKRQVRDMESGGAFISGLRKEWATQVGNAPPFKLVAVAGDRDEFVPSTSSIDPYPERFRKVVYGNHLEIVKPADTDHLGYKVVVSLLAGGAGNGPLSSARLAVESRKFQVAIDLLWPLRSELDEQGRVQLALALDSVARREEALQVLRGADKAETDALGTLAGMLKRRWLVEHRKADAEEAISLYHRGLKLSEDRNASQAFYHAINCAFLMLAYRDDADLAKHYAQRALDHCKASGANDIWRYATEGEARIYLGQTEEALSLYREAMKPQRRTEPWQIASMYQQSVRAADLTGNDDLSQRLPGLFCLETGMRS